MPLSSLLGGVDAPELYPRLRDLLLPLLLVLVPFKLLPEVLLPRAEDSFNNFPEDVLGRNVGAEFTDDNAFALVLLL